MKFLIALGLALIFTGCSIDPVPEASSVTEHATVERQDEPLPLSKWERDLLLNLWLHLTSEEVRLSAELDQATTPNEIAGIKQALIAVKEESDATWSTLFSDLR